MDIYNIRYRLCYENGQELENKNRKFGCDGCITTVIKWSDKSITHSHTPCCTNKWKDEIWECENCKEDYYPVSKNQNVCHNCLAKNPIFYIHRSSIFDIPRNRYRFDQYKKILEKIGAIVWRENYQNWDNQPEVVCFRGCTVFQAEVALSKIKPFKKYGPIIYEKW